MKSRHMNGESDAPLRGSGPVEPLALATLSELVGEPMPGPTPPPKKKPGQPGKASTAVVVGLCTIVLAAGVVNLAVEGTTGGAKADDATSISAPATTATTKPARPGGTTAPASPVDNSSTATVAPGDATPTPSRTDETTPATTPTSEVDAKKPATGNADGDEGAADRGGKKPDAQKPGGETPVDPKDPGPKDPVNPKEPARPQPVKPKPEAKPIVKPKPVQQRPQPKPEPKPVRPAPVVERPQPVVDTPKLPDGVAEVMQVLNAHRAQQGVPALQHDVCLSSRVAQPWAQFMARSGAPQIQGPSKAIETCPGYMRGWEQVGMGRMDGAGFVGQFAQSPGSRSHFLSPQYTHVGVGRAYDAAGRSYWVLELAGPNGV